MPSQNSCSCEWSACLCVSRVFLAGVLCVLSVMGCSCGGKGKPSSPQRADLKAGNGVAPVAFTLVGTPEITRSMHAHSPLLPGAGKDSYRFRGKIEYDQHTANIDFDVVPIAMGKTSQSYFLLNQDYFTPEKFQWYAVRNQCFDKVPLASLPDELHHVQLADREKNRLYKLWLIRENLDRPEIASKLFQMFVAEDTRSLFSERWQAGGAGRTALTDVLQKMRSPTDYATINPSLWAILRASSPTDDPQDIRAIGYSMLALEPAFARENLPKFLSDVEAKQVKDDTRILGLSPVAAELQRPAK